MSRGARPPRLAAWLLRRALPAAHREDLAHELEVRFGELAEREGEGPARRWYGRQVAAAWRPDVYFAWPGSAGWGADLRHGLRRWRRQPAHVAACVLVLALGAGGAAAVQAIFAWLTGSPVRVPAVEEVHTVIAADSAAGEVSSFDRAETYAFAEALGELESGRQAITAATVRRAGVTTHERIGLVDEDWFRLMRIRPAVGRLPASPDEVLLANAYWRGQLGGDVAVIGETIHVDREPYVVVGVAPADFQPPALPLLWRRVPDVAAASDARATLLVRLTDEAARLRARTRIQAVLETIDGQAGRAVRRADLRGVGVSGASEGERSSIARAGQLLMGLALLLLIGGIANAANLIGGDAARRHGELSVRAALGASRGRLTRQLLNEGALLGIATTAASVGVARLLLWGVPRWLPLQPGTRLDIELPTGAILVATGLSITAALLASAVPVRAALRDTSLLRSRSGAPVRTGRSRDALAAMQVAQAVVLIALAAGFARSMTLLRALPSGYAPDGTAVFQLTAPTTLFDTTRVREIQERTLAAVGERPEIRSASLITPVPIIGWTPREVRIGPASAAIPASELRTSANFFAAAGVRIVRGEAFRDGDRDVVVVTETLARSLHPDGDVVGRTIEAGEGVVLRIAGVTEVGTWGGSEPAAMMFRALRPGESRSVAVLVRHDVDWRGGSADLAATVRSVDPELTVTVLGSLHDLHDRAHLLTRGIGALAALFATLALLVSAIGLHANLAHRVATRTREIGIRIALGASHAGAVGEFTRSGMRVALVGLVAGLLIAAAATRLIQAMIFGVRPLDPVVLGSTAGILGIVALAATLLPARRIAAIDPARTVTAE